ncbi:unnamed protein product [Notodromas monacha]|uniref:Angiotensin-converting enzyme n=1 Tax=Notodromas monacha TaxID=399045 RepID=A0A7R9GGJ6_9CRUS|nr:unnamed protein product [Notodromas monacha]CAG0921783.1 unnamed protein product [Notodromas monacha]
MFSFGIIIAAALMPVVVASLSGSVPRGPPHRNNPGKRKWRPSITVYESSQSGKEKMRYFPLLLCAIFVLANSVYSAPGNKSPTSENVSDSTLKEISEKRDSEIKEAENSTKSLLPHHQEDPKLLTEKNASAADPKKDTISPSNNETSSAQKEPASSAKRQLTVEELKSYIEYYSEELRRRSNLKALIAWQFATNITEENSKAKVEGSLEMSTWKRNEWLHNISQFDLSVLESPHYQNLKRLFDQVKVLGTDALDGEKISKRTQLINEMSSTYSSAKICPFQNPDCDLEKDQTWSLEPDISNVFLEAPKKENYDLLTYVWRKWSDATGKNYRNKFVEYISLTNEAAKANKNPDIQNGASLWLQAYESKNIRQNLAKMYEELKPFYYELHAFVRYKLRKVYGEDKFDSDGPIPAHILGNMWAQSWEAIFPAVSEFKTKNMDVTDEMKKQGYDARKMFELADKFFKDLGLESVNEGAKDFYNLSMIEKPEGRKVVCHASAWDFSASNQLPGDFRIKMCTDVTMNDFITVHHELGHIQYYMQYVDQNPLFREGANPGFHEAIGDTLALSVSTPGHLQAIGLLDKDFKLDDDADLSYLLRVALDKVSFLPFGYLIDLYRWKLFEGEIEFKDLNDEWWLLR